jgi:hypothetical protein
MGLTRVRPAAPQVERRAEYLYRALAGASSVGWPNLPSGGRLIQTRAATGNMPDGAGVARPQVAGNRPSSGPAFSHPRHGAT